MGGEYPRHTYSSAEKTQTLPHWQSRLFQTTPQRRHQLGVPDNSNVTGPQLQKRQERLKKWEEFAKVATNLPSGPGAAQAKSFLAFSRSNRKVLESQVGYAASTKDSAWGQWGRAVDDMCMQTVGRTAGGAQTNQGFEDMLQELYKMVGYATKQHADNSGGGGGGAGGRNSAPSGGWGRGGEGAGGGIGGRGGRLPMVRQTQRAASSGGKGLGGGVSHYEDDKEARGTGGSHATSRGRREGEALRVTCHRILDEEGIGDEKQRNRVKELQNLQWQELYDRRNDPARMQRTRKEREDKRKAKLHMAAMHNASRLESRKSTGGETRGSRGKGKSEGEEEDVAQRFARLEQEKREWNAKKKMLQKNLQTQFTDTRDLPKDLFKAFCAADEDRTGQIDFEEFCEVCSQVGLKQLSKQDKRTLFTQCDKDGGGTVDFSEFLKVIVINLVHI